MNNGYLLVPSVDIPINLEQTTLAIPVPVGTQQVRASVVPTNAMRKRPQFGLEVQLFWTDSLGRPPLKRDKYVSYPKQKWSPEEIKEGLPDSGSAVGSPFGVLPHSVGPFPYEVNGAPAVTQINVAELPAGFDRVCVRYTLFGGSNGGPVNVAVVLEAMLADGTPLEFV